MKTISCSARGNQCATECATAADRNSLQVQV